MLLRVLLALAIVFLAWWLLRQIISRISQQRRPPVSSSRGGLRVNSVRCARCGLFLPEAEAVQSAGRYFCSVEHRDAMKDNGSSA